MSGTKNVIEMAAHRPPYDPPGHFKKQQRAAWDELVTATPATLHVAENRFTFEFASTLLARFRAGRSMTVAELKELRAHMASLGLRQDGAPQPRKANKLDKYRR